MSQTGRAVTRKITAPQVNLLWGRCASKGIKGTRAILEFLEFECKIDSQHLAQLEDLTPIQLDKALRTLEVREDVG